MRNKRGEEMVEAAIVLPILILTILSMILLILYYYNCLHDQTALHHALQTEAGECRGVIRILRKESEVSAEMRGLADMVMHKDISGRMYALDYGTILRAGELIEPD